MSPEQPVAQRLSHRHRQLLGLDASGEVDERPRRGGKRKAIPPDGWNILAVKVGVLDLR